MEDLSTPSKLHDLFSRSCWKEVVHAIDQGQVLLSPLKNTCNWEKMFPNGVSVDDAKLLKKCGFDLHAHIGKGLMHYACEKGDATSVENLLDIGVDPCAPGEFNMCPLVYALYGQPFTSGSLDTVEQLLKRGANPNAPGLGSTGRSQFVLLEVLPTVYSRHGWEGVNRLWQAFEPGVDWSLKYEGNTGDASPRINYFLMDVAARQRDNASAFRDLFVHIMQKLVEAGVSFDPKFRDLGYPTLEKYAANQGDFSKWLMEARSATLLHTELHLETPRVGSCRNNPRL